MVAPSHFIRTAESTRGPDSTRAQTWLAGTSAPDLIRLLASAGCRVVGSSGQSPADAPATVIVIVEKDELPNAGQLRKLFGLTDREAHAALLLAERLTNKEVAQALGVSQKTAWRHTEGVFRKLQVSSRLDVRARLLRSRRRQAA